MSKMVTGNHGDLRKRSASIATRKSGFRHDNGFKITHPDANNIVINSRAITKICLRHPGDYHARFQNFEHWARGWDVRVRVSSFLARNENCRVSKSWVNCIDGDSELVSGIFLNEDLLLRLEMRVWMLPCIKFKHGFRKSHEHFLETETWSSVSHEYEYAAW